MSDPKPAAQDSVGAHRPTHSRSFKAVILASSQVLNTLAGLVLSTGLAWSLDDPDVYGAYQQILLINTTLSGPLTVGLPTAIYYFLPRLDASLQKGFLLAAHGVLIVSGMALSAFLFFGAELLAAWMKSPHLAPMLRVFFPLPIFLLPQMILDATLVSQGRVLTLVGIQIAMRITMVASVLVPVLLGYGLTTSLFLWVWGAALLQTMAVLLVFRPLRHVSAAWKTGLTREIADFTAPIVLITIVSPFALAGDKILVSLLFGAGVYAVYINGTYAISMVYLVILRSMSVIIPDFSRMIHENRWNELVGLWGRATFKAGLIVFAMVGFVLAGAQDIVRTLFSARYIDSVPVMRIAILGVMPRILFASAVLQAMGKTRAYASITGVAFLVTPGSVLLFGSVLDLGAQGAAWGYVVGEYIHAAYQVALVRWVVRQDPLRVFPVARLVGLAMYSISLCLALFAAADAFLGGLPPVARLAAVGIPFPALYLYGVLALRIAYFDTDIAPLLRMVRIPLRVVPAMLRTSAPGVAP